MTAHVQLPPLCLSRPDNVTAAFWNKFEPTPCFAPIPRFVPIASIDSDSGCLIPRRHRVTGFILSLHIEFRDRLSGGFSDRCYPEAIWPTRPAILHPRNLRLQGTPSMLPSPPSWPILQLMHTFTRSVECL